MRSPVARSIPRAAVRDGPFRARVCCGSGCVGRGALEVLEALREAADTAGGAPPVAPSAGISGCHGWCSRGPLVEIPDLDLLYCGVSPDDATEIVERTLLGGEPVPHLLEPDQATGGSFRGRADNPFFAGQVRRVLGRCGVVDPEDLDHAVSLGAYHGLQRVVAGLDPAQVVEAVKRSGLRELGGPGFPVGLKWALVADTPGDGRFVVGNGDSGDPGLTVDRTLVEGDPHAIIEGLAIAGFAVGARQGRLFLRSEHALAVARARRAVAQARRRGFVGPAVLGSTFGFEIEILESAGACTGGEETALINLLQGRRAAARPRPPFPAVRGLWGRPTLINTLETLANVPLVFDQRHDGPGPGRLTKVVAVTGAVARPGLVEVPLGTPVARVVEEIAGSGGRDRLRAVHIGGPGGLTLGPDDLETAIDHDVLREAGASLGSGGLVVLAEDDCVVRLARYLVAACAEQSCGTCPPCRIGTRVLLNLVDRVSSGAGETGDLESLTRLCHHIRRTSLCEIGRAAPMAVISGLDRFRREWEAHLAGRG